MKRIGFLFLIAAILILLVSCTGPGTDENASSVEQQGAAPESDGSIMEPTASMAGAESDQKTAEEPEEIPASDDRPSWLNIALKNARTGETFTLSDFGGRQVFVEPMATWCSNCRRQLTNVRAAKEQLGDDTVFIALSVETNIDDATLATYANDAGFDWLFAVATPNILEQLTAEFGRAIVNPPATPHFIINADGSYSELFTGIDPTAEIVSLITAAQS
jgi:hypothetical protein